MIFCQPSCNVSIKHSSLRGPAPWSIDQTCSTSEVCLDKPCIQISCSPSVNAVQFLNPLIKLVLDLLIKHFTLQRFDLTNTHSSSFNTIQFSSRECREANSRRSVGKERGLECLMRGSQSVRLIRDPSYKQ